MKKHLTFDKTILVIVILHLCVISGRSEKYVIKNFTPQEYKAGIQNIDFAQNRDMTIYVANNLGVLSFNGSSWNQHDVNTGKKKRSLAFDEVTNRLYVGSQGEFGFYEKNWEYVSLLDKLPKNAPDFDEVWDVYILNSQVYFCTFSAIFIYNGESISMLSHKNGFDRCFLTNGKLFAQSQLGELFHIEHGSLIPLSIENKSNQIIAGLVSIEDGYLVFFNSGLITFTSSFGSNDRFRNLNEALKGTYVNHVLQISDARLAIATQTSGLFLYDIINNRVEQITKGDGLQSNACLRAFQDFSGNLWVGMQNGIAIIYTNSPLRFLNTDIHLQGSGYESIQYNGDGYYSTSNGIYYLAEDAGESRLLEGTEGPAYGLQKIGGRLYAGHHTGLFMLDQGRVTRVVETEGMWNLKQLESRPDYYIGGMYSGLYLFRFNVRGQLIPLNKIEGFNESSRFYEEDANGVLWVGQYYKGLYKLTFSDDMTLQKTERVANPRNLPINDQIILGKIDNDLYVGTQTGMYHINVENDEIEDARNFKDVIGDQHVYSFKQDNQNNVHIIAENLVGYFKHISNSNYQFVPSPLYHLRYFLNNDLLNFSYNDDKILYSANEGFITYYPNIEGYINQNHPLEISRIYSVTQDTAYHIKMPFGPQSGKENSIEISYKDRVLQIDVEYFEFTDVNNQQFRFLLKGFDDDYGAWSATPSKEYTNLKEGDYELVVQSRSFLGSITTSQPVFVKVKPPFYRSMTAKVLYVLLGLASLVFVAWFQKRRYTIKVIGLEEEKNIKVAEEKLKVSEIKRQKEKELMQLKDEKLKSEIEHVNSLLAASTMNLVVKNEFIDMIKAQLNDLKKKGENSETKKTLEFIIHEIDTTLRLKEDWEQFEYRFDRVHGDFLSRLREEYEDLTPNEQKLCAFLRLNLSTKEIANSMSISLRGVEVARYRLRKKLGLNKGENLSKFVLEY
ncbi:MAG: hypothetical protein HKN68_08385 [Saprospiraceae bacterium]|nr:hypothetical protein [Saprospiraceae bacterium]